jgi:hypothetical protein
MLALVLSVGGLACASAQAPTTSAPAKATLSSQSKVRDLIGDPDAKAVLEKLIPQVVNNPQLEMGYDLKLREIQQFEPALTDDVLAGVDKALAEMQAKRGR